MKVFEKLYEFFSLIIPFRVGSGSGNYLSANQVNLAFNGKAYFNYDFLMSLKEKDYPKYLSIVYFNIMRKKLNLKHPKTLSEKIQWLKIYDATPLKAQLTDKVLVRDWIKEKIGEQYLKPALQVCNNFDEINWDSLPNSFIIKCNHGCKWHAVVKNKNEFLATKKLYDFVKNKINRWLSESFFGYSDFEVQYKYIVDHKIIIEPLLRENLNNPFKDKGMRVFCFNSQPKIIYYFEGDIASNNRIFSAFDENYKPTDLSFGNDGRYVNKEADEIIKKAVDLSKILAKDFKFVAVDWFIFQDKLYFEEMTFTPYSGFFFNDKSDIKMGMMLNLKGD